MKEHLEQGTFKTGRMEHEAGGEPQVRDRILNLVEAEVGEGKKKSPWNQSMATDARHMGENRSGAPTLILPKSAERVKRVERARLEEDMIRAEGEISAVTSSLLTDRT